jgi:leucyl-tRNA synthetase
MKYVLCMFPYPSGEGLHIGHAYNYAVMDTYCRWYRMMGEDVFQPFGYDAFGLPAENYARKVGKSPSIVTMENIIAFRGQMARMNTEFDQKLTTTDQGYQKWTQWLFLQLKERGLAYKAERPEPYCPACETVLAKSEVSYADTCLRCYTPVTSKSTPQWFFRITDYKDRLISGLDTVDYPEGTKAQQRHWLENLTDWCVSRQRKWGCPIPIEGETDTLDTFVDSSFYFVRYCDPTNMEQLCAPEKYIAVDLCVGGTEHACAHLIYARFIHYFLFDIGAVPMEEPFRKVVHQGMITKDGAKMSKSTGNVVNPDSYHPDELRMQLMFIGPYTEGGDWNDGGIIGVRRFLNKMNRWTLRGGFDPISTTELVSALGQRIERLQFNTCISDLMKFYNQHKGKAPDIESVLRIRSIMNCFAPKTFKS